MSTDPLVADTFDIAAARMEILDYCLQSMTNRLNFNTQGNISIRVPAQQPRFLITPTDLEYDKMRPEHIVLVDEYGQVTDGDLRPSSEVTVHIAVYRRRPDVQAIVHTEPVYANTWGVIGEPIRGTLVNMVIYTKGDVPIMPFMLSNCTEFGEAMCDVMGARNAVVWANHGLLTVGPTLREAFKTSVAVESAAQVQILARTVTATPALLDYASLGLDQAL